MQKVAGQEVSKLKRSRSAIPRETDDTSFEFALIESLYSTDVVHCSLEYAMVRFIADVGLCAYNRDASYTRASG